MIDVGMGDQDLFDRPGRCRLQRLQVRRVRGPGVDDRPSLGLRAPHQVAVGAGAGHHAGVGRSHADDPGRQAHHPAGHDVRVGREPARRVDPADLGPGVLVRQHHPLALGRFGPARHGQRHFALRPGMVQRRLDTPEACQHLQGAAGHGQQLQTPPRVQRLGRREPHQFHRLAPIGLRRLPRGRTGDEEAGGKALGCTGRRQPVAEVGPLAQVDAKCQFITQGRDGVLAAL